MKKIITRLSFNSNGWHHPSGAIGKSKNPIHEHIYGFGFEEWLFNKTLITKDIDGAIWHFGYIEGIHKNYRPGDENFPLNLFTIDAITRNRYLVSEIREWQKLDPNDAKILISQNPNFINQMQNDLIPLANTNAISKFLQHQNDNQLFNIKFKEFSYCYDINNPLPRTNRIYKLNRFWLYR
jgi:hypothetical protein